MEKLRILFVTMEIEPFLKISSAADIIRLLPQGLQEKGHEIRILMPRFGIINEKRNKLHEVVRLSGINIKVGQEERPLTIKVATIPNARLQVYFLDNEDYFKRKSVLYDNNDNFYVDNDERSIFFCKGVLETVKKLGWAPNIIHCHDWMSALIPLYMKTQYKDDPIFKDSKVVYTVYDNQTDHPLPNNFTEKTQMDGLPLDLIKQYSTGKTYLSVSQGGMKMADAVTKGLPLLRPEIEGVLPDNTQYFGSETGRSIVDCYDELYQQILVN